MIKISYQVGDKTGEIYWAASEYFSELTGKTFSLGKMEAAEIEQLPNLSLRAKILLSAVAGAVIQHLLEQNLNTEIIFKQGNFSL